MRMTSTHLLVALAAIAACRGAPPGVEDQVDLGRLVDSLMPAVERATGLTFKATPASAMRTRDEVRSFLLAKLEAEFPDRRLQGVTTAYRLFGLIPDSLDLKQLILDLYAEQVAGYYDPDSLTLYGVADADPSQTKLVMAHELVHALQHQYLAVDSLLHIEGDSDRLAAAQAMLEGHATLASLRVLVPGADVTANPDFWGEYRTQVRGQQSAMAVFSKAPLVLRESLIFPYLGGAEFMRWWASAHPGETLPLGAAIPASTEQVLFPARYAGGDQPVALRFVDSADSVLHEDTLGEFEVQLVSAVLRGLDQINITAPLGWGGDRYRIVESAEGPALVWYIVWDSPAVAQRFGAGSGARLAARTRPGYHTTVESVDINGLAGHRVIIAPTRWAGWRNPPMITIPDSVRVGQ